MRHPEVFLELIILETLRWCQGPMTIFSLPPLCNVCYRLNVCASPSNSYVETLTHNATIYGSEAFGRLLGLD